MKVLPRFEPVLWLYDGLKGKVIQWTRQHGSEETDPSVLAFVVGTDGEVAASMLGGSQYRAPSLARWALEQADAYEKLHPTTRMPFVRATVTTTGAGDAARPACAELDAARKANKPVLLYVGRGSAPDGDAKAKKEAKLARAFEKGTLDSKTAAKEAEGWTLLRLDLADDLHAALAKQLGADTAPALLLFAPGATTPEVLARQITAASLAVLLKKHRPAEAPK